MTILDRLLSLFVVPEQERLRNLLVPELADLRQQLDQARRLAGEAQARYRRTESGLVESHEKECVLTKERNILLMERSSLTMERDRLSVELARAKADLDERHGPLLGPLAMERDQLKADNEALRTRVAELAQKVRLLEDDLTHGEDL